MLNKITEEAAYEVGAKGAAPTEHERKLFEAWMRGHCWAVSGTWDGTTYVGSAENKNYIDPHVMNTRQLWAAWRDRGSLAAPACLHQITEPAANLTDAQIDEVFNRLPDGATGFLKTWGYQQFARELIAIAAPVQADARDSEPAAGEQDARKFWAVIAPCGEGVLFADEKDALWTQSGTGMFVTPTLGDQFRELYGDEELELMQLNIPAQTAQQTQGGRKP